MKLYLKLYGRDEIVLISWIFNGSVWVSCSQYKLKLKNVKIDI